MDELLAMFLEGQRQFGVRVEVVTDAQWDGPTPDTEWSVADLVNHLIEEQRWVGPLLHGLDLDSAGKIVEGSRSLPVHGGVGANLAQEWSEAATSAADAVVEPGVLDREVELSRGRTPAREYLAEMVFDLTVHSWDLGKAIGYPSELPQELVRFTYDMIQRFGDMSGTGMFGEPVAVADDAPMLDKLLARTGRDPAR